MKDYRLYILMRTDLDSMKAGRAAAQASHAANAFIHQWGTRGDVKDWQKQTKQGFGTAIVLGTTKEEIDHIFLKKTIPSGKVYDPEYGVKTTWEIFKLLDKKSYNTWDSSDFNEVVFYRKEITCAYIFGTKEELEPLLGALPLYS